MNLNIGGRSRRGIRVSAAARKTGCSVATVWRLSARGAFPLPVKLTPGVTIWFEDEIEAWLEDKAAERSNISRR